MRTLFSELEERSGEGFKLDCVQAIVDMHPSAN